MLDLKDFFHLPQVDVLLEQLAAQRSGLILVAGLDPAAVPGGAAGFLPSGRATIFRILVRQLLEARQGHVVVVSENRDAVRVPRQFKRRVELAPVEAPLTYTDRILYASTRRPALLVVDRLDPQSVPAALEAAQRGFLVLAQLDTVFSGAGVARHLRDAGVPAGLLEHLAWIVAVQRVAMLCSHCKQPVQPDPDRLAELHRCCPFVSLKGTFFRAGGCEACGGSGRVGNLSVFDVFRAGADPATRWQEPSLLPATEYILRLAVLGHVPLEDALNFDADQLHRTYNLLAASERAVTAANTAMERKLAELQSAHQVLQQRTEALISLQDVSHTLVTLTDPDELAARICRYTHDLCRADRAVLYVLQPDGVAEVLAVNGWDPSTVHRRLDALQVLGTGRPTTTGTRPAPFAGYPPGVLVSRPAAGSPVPKAGLRVPLVAQHEVVGLMIVHTTQRAEFAPGEVAMLQTFANQAAVALQRAGLIDALQDKIAQLEAAQAELVHKERMERELELARQVQQRLLPRIFPLVPGYTFAARCEPARQVGGDFYDVILLDADRFGVVVADVSDKGMPAALFMALTRSLLLAEARRERSPRTVLSNVHRLLLELGEPTMFVTLFYGVVDVTTGRLTYTRAGHDRPLLLRDGSARPLGGRGTFIGFLDIEQVRLSEEQVDLLPGDRLVLYTDGLVDALNPEGRSFDLARLVALLESNAALPAAELCAATFAGLAVHQGHAEQYDDMTMLAVEVGGLEGHF